MSTDRTVNIGYVHVGDDEAIAAEGRWVCAENCPHPVHRYDAERAARVSDGGGT